MSYVVNDDGTYTECDGVEELERIAGGDDRRMFATCPDDNPYLTLVETPDGKRWEYDDGQLERLYSETRS